MTLGEKLNVDPREFFVDSEQPPPAAEPKDPKELARLRREYLLDALRDELETDG